MFTFDHINKSSLENMFERDLTRVLHQYQNEIFKGLMKKEKDYVSLSKNIAQKSNVNNTSLIQSFKEFNTGGLFGTLRNYMGISYALGVTQALKEFNIQKKLNVTHDEKKNFISDANELMKRIEDIYENMIINALLKNLMDRTVFPVFIREVQSSMGKVNIEKANRKLFLPNFPDLKNIVNNIKIGETTKSFVKGMVNVFRGFGSVELMQYKTQEDEKVSSVCRKWHGELLPINKIDGIIPQHRNCRCRWIPDT